MATLGLGTDLTVAELIRREDPDGKLAQLVDMLTQENRILEDITWLECNNGTYHEDTRTVGEPTGQERTYDEGVTKEAGRTEKVLEPTCMLNGISEVDVKKIQHHVARGSTPAEARMMEDGFFLRGMTKTLVSRLFDGNRTTDPRRINGINTRSDYNTLQTYGSETRVFDNAGGDCADASVFTSMYIIQWGFKKVECIYPRNDPQGGGILPIKMEDYGKSIITQASDTSGSKKYPAWQTWFSADFGLFIFDPRCIKRVCNIAVGTAADNAHYFTFDENALSDAVQELEYGGQGAVIYCNKAVLKQAQRRANDKGTANFTMDSEGEGPFAHPVVRYQGIPMKRVDQITNTQANVTT